MVAVYEVTIGGNRYLAEVTTRAGVENAKLRQVWDDTRAGAWDGEFGWVPLMPEEQVAVDVAQVKRATRRVDLQDAFSTLDN